MVPRQLRDQETVLYIFLLNYRDSIYGLKRVPLRVSDQGRRLTFASGALQFTGGIFMAISDSLRSCCLKDNETKANVTI
jgi:hypothetical protein